MAGRRLLLLVVVLAAVLLHLPAHIGREPLAEDAPAFAANPRLVQRPAETLLGTLGRVAMDPGVAWTDDEGAVGARRWRPVTAVAFAVQRAVPWGREPGSLVVAAALLSLALHVLVAVQSVRLVEELGGDRRAQWVAGLLVAASPTALAAAAWPARQGVVLAAALGVTGLRLAVREGFGRLLAAGLLLTLAALAHELAYGLAVAALALRAVRGGGARAVLPAWPVAALPAAAAIVRQVVLSRYAAGLPVIPVAVPEVAGPNALDGMVGVVIAAGSLLLPARLHLADGPWRHGALAHAAALAAVAAAIWFLWRSRRAPAAVVALAFLLALSPLLLLGRGGGSPYADSYLYIALPIGAAAVGIALARAAVRGRTQRIAVALAGALLVGASVAGTVTRSPAFATREAHAQLALEEAPGSPVTRAWDLSLRANESQDPDTAAALLGEADALATAVGGEAAALHRSDAVAATTVGGFLAQFAMSIRAKSPPDPADPRLFQAERIARAATELRPQSAHAWHALAVVRFRNGLLRSSYEAVMVAAAIGPDDPEVLITGAEVALSVGNARLAANVMDRAAEITAREQAGHPIELPPARVLFHARALAGDGALRVPDPGADLGMRYRFDLAADLLERLLRRRDAPAETRATLHRTYVLYGDFLASLDRTAMALLAYERALALAAPAPGEGPNRADEHLSWLRGRLAGERMEAEQRVRQAEQGVGNIADALVELYVAFCREGAWSDADDLFTKLETDLRGIPTKLRFHRAVHRYASLDEPRSQETAEQELRRVLEEDATLARAHFELARVLEWRGTAENLRDAQRHYQQAADLAIVEEWSLDAVERAEAIAEFLRQEEAAAVGVR